MMTPPTAGEEEANSRHGEKSKIRSKINLFISGYVKTDPLPEDTDTYGECFYVSSPYSSALPRTSAGAPSSPASAGDAESSFSSRDRESEENKQTDDSEDDLEGINVKSCGSRDLPSGLRESHSRAKSAFLGQFNPKPQPRFIYPWEQESQTTRDENLAASAHKKKDLHGNDYLAAFFTGNKRRLRAPLWAAVDTGAAATCVTDDFPIPLDHARPPRPEENMMGIDGVPVAPVEVGDFTIDAIDPATREPLEPIHIKNATKLKNSPINLLSVSMMTSSGCSFYFGPDAAWMKYNGVKFQLKKKKGIYYLRLDKALGSDLVHGLAALNPDWYDACDDGDGNLVALGATMDVWHKRFGHVSPKTVKFIFDNDAVTGMQVKGKDNPHTPECKCPQCMQLKAKRVHIGDYRPDREHHATQVGETLHCDLHGPMPTSITTGASYYMSVIDEASRWSLIFFLEHKDDATLAMEQAIKYFDMHGHRVKNVHTDGGGEFGGGLETSTGKKTVHGEAEEPWCRTTEWNELLTSHKIFHRISPAHVKELHGIAEAYNKTLLLLGNALLFNARIAPGLFCEAFAHANFLRNRLPVPGVQGAVTPYQLFHHRTYDATYLRTWGCDCYAARINSKTGETKNLPGHAPGRRYIYIGEAAQGRMGFRCLDPETLEVKTLLHVSFDEHSIERRRDKLREWDRRASAFKKNELEHLPLIQDDWEIYGKDHTELNKATEVRRLFVDYDRPFESNEGGGDRDGKSDEPVDMELLDATPPVRSVPVPDDPFHNGDTESAKESGSTNQKSATEESVRTGLCDSPALSKSAPDSNDILEESVREHAQQTGSNPRGATAGPAGAEKAEASRQSAASPSPRSSSRTTKDLFRELRGRDLYASDAPSILDAAATDDHAQQRGPFSEENRARYLFGKAVENESRVRPLRTRKDTKRDKLTVDEREFLQQAQQGDWPIVWAPNPKSGKSQARYERYSKSSTIRSAYEIMGKKGKSQMWMDLKNDFLKGHIDFPGHTSIEHAEATDARSLAAFAGVPLFPGLFEFSSYGPLGDLDADENIGLTDEDIIAMALHKDHTLLNAMGMLQHEHGATPDADSADPTPATATPTASSTAAGAPAGDIKGEQKAAQDAPDGLSESVYSFDPHQKDLFGQASQSRSSTARAEHACFEKATFSPDYSAGGSPFASTTASSKARDGHGSGSPPTNATASTRTSSKAHNGHGSGSPPTNATASTRISPEAREGWWKAILTEWNALLEYGAFKIVPIEESEGQKLFSALWVLKRKFSGATSAITRLKARLVVRGFEQRPGQHFDESSLYAGVMMYSSLRTLLSIATSKGHGISLRDVKNAYVQSDLPDALYMQLPAGFSQEGKCLRLAKALYGLRQAGHLWSTTFSGYLRSLGFERNIADPSIHSLVWKDGTTGSTRELHVGSYVDDLTIISSDPKALAWLDAKLSARFPMQAAEARNLDAERGEQGVGWVLSMEVLYYPRLGICELKQEHSIEKLAAKYGVTESKPVSLPMSPHVPLVPAGDGDELIDYREYLSCVGGLLHISQVSRPDIAYAVGALTRFSVKPTQAHLDAAVNCIRYLYSTKDRVIRYVRDPVKAERNIPYVLNYKPSEDDGTMFCDADYAGSHDSRSCSGMVCFLNGGPISWASKIQKLVSTSTCQSELISLAETVKEALHIRLLLEELGARPVGVPMRIHEDNSAALEMAMSDKHFSKAKHFKVRQSFVRENCRPLEEGLTPTATVIQTPTHLQLSDGLTKALSKDLFKVFQDAVTTTPLCIDTKEALLACTSSPVHWRGGWHATSTKASPKVGDAGVLSGGTGFRLVGCLRADGRSFASIGAGKRRPWHVPRPDLLMRYHFTKPGISL